MRKWFLGGTSGLLLLLGGVVLPVFSASAETSAPVTYSSISQTLVAKAQADLDRIQGLVAQGTLPKSRLAEAEASLADAEDQAVLANTLYSSRSVQELTVNEAAAMVDAAQRRVDRQEAAFQSRQKLLDMGIIARSDLTALADELDSRKRVLELAHNRSKLLDELKQMAKAEEQLERSAAEDVLNAAKNVMVRYDGNGLFDFRDLTTVSSQFEKQFHRQLPVSALGQTAVHQAMGLDHRNRVDVALNPDQGEGIWLLALLQRLHIPYFAFRSAVAGAATAPHIHIGPGSQRLKLAQR